MKMSIFHLYLLDNLTDICPAYISPSTLQLLLACLINTISLQQANASNGLSTIIGISVEGLNVLDSERRFKYSHLLCL